MRFVRKKQLWEQVLLWMAIVIAGGMAWWLTQHYELTEVWVRSAGWWGPVVAVGLYALLSLTPIPSDGLTILCCVLYGWQTGFVLSWVGNTVAAMVEYFIFRDLRAVTHFDIHTQPLPKWLKKFPVESVWFLIGVRFVPGVGGKIVSIMAGMYKIGWWRFLWTTAIANILGSFIYILIGWGLKTFFGPSRPLNFMNIRDVSN